jgi:hypothetical protein
MKSTKKLTIPIDSHLHEDKKSAAKNNRANSIDGSASKTLSRKF